MIFNKCIDCSVKCNDIILSLNIFIPMTRLLSYSNLILVLEAHHAPKNLFKLQKPDMFINMVFPVKFLSFLVFLVHE